MNIYNFLEENFTLIRREEYRECNLSMKTKEILCDIGLPQSPLEFICFDNEGIDKIQLGEQHIIIGADFGTYICINSKNEIVSVDPKQEYPTRFINKNLYSFLECIVIFLLYQEKYNEINDEEVDMFFKDLKKEFDRVDIRALNSGENWWSIILEELELGLM